MFESRYVLSCIKDSPPISGDVCPLGYGTVPELHYVTTDVSGFSQHYDLALYFFGIVVITYVSSLALGLLFNLFRDSR